MTKEIWKDYPGSDGRYRVSNCGRVWGYYRDKILSPGIYKRTGYPYHSITMEYAGRAVKKKVHNLVLETFVGPRPEGMQGCHNDGNPKNNRVDNLRWDTPLNNTRDKHKHGTMVKGEDVHFSKLKEQDVLEIYAHLQNGVPHRKIAKMYDVVESLIGNIARNKVWKHVEREAIHNHLYKCFRYEKNFQRAKQIMARKDSGVSLRQIANEFGMNPSNIYRDYKRMVENVKIVEARLNEK